MSRPTRSSSTKDLHYEAIATVQGKDPYYFRRNDNSVPAELCVRNIPPTMRPRCADVLVDLTKKYDDELQDELKERGLWTCWNCGKGATEAVHTPGSHLHENPPLVRDWVQPVCKRDSVCNQEAHKMMHELMMSTGMLG